LFAVLSLSGCMEASFGESSPGYDEQACVERGLRRHPDPLTVKTARVVFEDDCNRGSPEACSALGVMNEIGVGVPMNQKRAVALYERACQTGNVRGCTNLAVARIEGIGGERSVLFGARVLGPACDHGDAWACLHLARLHEEGQGTSRDPALAARLFSLACNGEEASACVAMAERKASAGQFTTSSDFYSKACSLGDQNACGHVAMPIVSPVVASLQ
jgi:TPR repeat protein